MAFIEWVLQYKWVILFYLVLAIIIFINRKKFQVESKFILLYRTKYGINLINKFADKYKEFVKVVGYSAIGLGFIGMLTIAGFFVKGIYDLLFVPSAPPTMSLVIPGIQIPGSPIFIPFWYGIIALFIVVLFHEFGHGVVSRAHGIPVKSTGIVFFGPLIGAFVEPDEKKLVKQPSPVQVSMFAAGPFFNAILVGIIFLITSFIFYPIIMSMAEPTGITFNEIQENYSAEQYGLKADIAYMRINNFNITNYNDFSYVISSSRPGDNLTFYSNDSNTTVTVGSHPDDNSRPYLGVFGPSIKYELKENTPKNRAIYSALLLFSNPFATTFLDYALLEWILILSLGIGLANLLPLGPVDGGRMLHTTLVDINGKEKGTKLWLRISLITFIVLIILIIVPILKSVILGA